MKKGLIVKKNANLFSVDSKNCVARKNLKQEGIFVGDYVEYDEKQLSIERVLPRKNLLVRPPIANVDKMLIVIAPTPKPDFYLVDKLLIFCKLNGIKPVLVINKSDILSEKLKKQIESVYKNLLPICFVSAMNNSAKQVAKFVKGICAFAGQSAVGKSSLVNAILDKNEKVGELSRRTDRGKQTTRLVSLYELSKGNYLADTAGFSKLDESLIDLDAESLDRYFYDFIEFIPDCQFTSCNHIAEKKCGVKAALKLGKIAEQRYNSYERLFSALKQIRRVYEKKD